MLKNILLMLIVLFLLFSCVYEMSYKNYNIFITRLNTGTYFIDITNPQGNMVCVSHDSTSNELNFYIKKVKNIIDGN